jgi:hypothetical protein
MGGLFIAAELSLTASHMIDRRQLEPGSKRDNPIKVDRGQYARRHDQAGIRRASKSGKVSLDLLRILLALDGSSAEASAPQAADG